MKHTFSLFNWQYYLTGSHYVDKLFVESVSVLLKKTFALIFHLINKETDRSVSHSLFTVGII